MTTEDTNVRTEDTADPDVTGDTDDVTADNDTIDDDDEDPIEAAIAARVQLELERQAATTETRVRAELAARQADEYRRQANATNARVFADSFGDAVKKARESIKAQTFHDEDGKVYRLTDEAIEDMVVKPFQAHNSVVQQAVQTQTLTAIAEAAVGLLPADVREEFGKQADGKPLDEWLRTFAEMLAPATTHSKTMSKELEAKLKAAEARGFAKGQRTPPGTPRQVNERSTQSTTPDLNTLAGAAGALSKGQITAAKYLEIRQKLQS